MHTDLNTRVRQKFHLESGLPMSNTLIRECLFEQSFLLPPFLFRKQTPSRLSLGTKSRRLLGVGVAQPGLPGPHILHISPPNAVCKGSRCVFEAAMTVCTVRCTSDQHYFSACYMLCCMYLVLAQDLSFLLSALRLWLPCSMASHEFNEL